MQRRKEALAKVVRSPKIRKKEHSAKIETEMTKAIQRKPCH